MSDVRTPPCERRRGGAGARCHAPDGSEIRFLPALRGGSMVHCTLPPGLVSKAVAHRTVEEIWCFLEGEGEVWRIREGVGEEVAVSPGAALTIPLGNGFQIRNTGSAPLRLVIVTIPPGPAKTRPFGRRIAGRRGE